MPTALQNTEVEESLIKQASESEPTTFNPLEGDLIEDDEGVVADDGGEESDDSSDGETSEDVKLPEGDLEESDADEEGEPEDGEDAEEVAEDSEGLSSTLKKATENIPAGRDYSKYSDEDAKFLKQMSNEAFEHFSKRSEEFATIAKQLDEIITHIKDADSIAEYGSRGIVDQTSQRERSNNIQSIRGRSN